MRFFVVGLGSMGKRRIRCLDRLGYTDVVGYDIDEDRRRYVEQEYGTETVEDIDEALFEETDSVIVSTPPHAHNQYIRLAIDHGVPAFVEASVIRDGLPELARAANEAGVLVAPSCTMRFHPAIRDISRIVHEGAYGEITNFSYHMGHYLPDWHPWEDVQDFYVSRQDTSATREMVPFELTWLVDIVGYPETIDGYHGSTTDVGADIDDTYAMTVSLPTGYGTLLVDVVSRFATRRLTLNLERAQISWSWSDDKVRVYEGDSARWIEYKQPDGETHGEYNENIIEDMYVNELEAFIDAVRTTETYPHSLEEDIRILDLLNEVEN